MSISLIFMTNRPKKIKKSNKKNFGARNTMFSPFYSAMGMKWRHDNMLSISLGCPRHASPLRPLRPLHTCIVPSGRLLNSIIFIIKGGDAIFMPPLHIVFLELHFLTITLASISWSPDPVTEAVFSVSGVSWSRARVSTSV